MNSPSDYEFLSLVQSRAIVSGYANEETIRTTLFYKVVDFVTQTRRLCQTNSTTL
jgi:hypothetical protein